MKRTMQERRSDYIAIRMTPNERLFLESLAEERGAGLSEALRSILAKAMAVKRLTVDIQTNEIKLDKY